jgi:predicted kinase
VDIPDELITLERAAEQARQALAGLDGDEHDAQWQRWREAAERFQAAVTAHAMDSGESRYEVEQAVKRAVRHPEVAAA